MMHEKERCHMENVGNAFEGDTSYKKKTSNQLRRVIKGRKKGGELCIINILVVGLERRHTQKMARMFWAARVDMKIKEQKAL